MSTVYGVDISLNGNINMLNNSKIINWNAGNISLDSSNLVMNFPKFYFQTGGGQSATDNKFYYENNTSIFTFNNGIYVNASASTGSSAVFAYLNSLNR